MSTDTQQGQKTIRVPRGLQGPDIPQLAREVVDKCKYIHASKVGEVERHLYSLMEYEALNGHNGQIGPPSHGPPSRAAPPGPPPPQRSHPQAPLLPSADVRLIEEYADQLYEDSMELKAQGAKCILRCCTDPANLEFLISDHERILGVLSRELKENTKKSFELSVAIVSTFLCFSHFSEFHPVLMQSQCGDVTMRVVEWEAQRHKVRKQEVERQMLRHAELGPNVTPEEKKTVSKGRQEIPNSDASPKQVDDSVLNESVEHC
jgi:hypothetical protein